MFRSPIAVLSASALASVSLWGAAPAQGAYPATPLQRVTTLPVFGNPQDTAMNPIDDTVYVVGTSPYTLTAYNGTLDDSQSVDIGTGASRVAVNPTDDTVYVTDRSNPGYIDIYPGDLSSRQRLPVTRLPEGITVHPLDDTIYVTYSGDSRIGIINPRQLDDSVTVNVGNSPISVAVNPIDDTIYVANNTSGTVSIIDPISLSVQTINLGGTSPVIVAVHPTDDTVYVSGFGDRRLIVANADFSQVERISYSDGPFAYAFDLTITPDGSTVYAATQSHANQSVAFNAHNMDDSMTFTVGSDPVGVAANDSVAYFANNGSRDLAVVTTAPTITGVSPDKGPVSGGTGITITGAGFVPGITTATVGGMPLDDMTVTPTSITGRTRPSSAGLADVTVTKWGLQMTAAGAFTFIPPPVPPGAPASVVAMAGVSAASLAWLPASPGSYPITHYQAVASPGGAQCLTSSTTCTITGLRNGTTYTFIVRALNGAGWGPWSTPSNAVTPSAPPQPSIMITGTRGELKGKAAVIVTGTSTGLGMGAILRPWLRFPGQTTFAQGNKDILVDAAGDFNWKRRTSKKVTVYVQTPDGSVTSNRVTIRTTD